jgi:hypothetical protein
MREDYDLSYKCKELEKQEQFQGVVNILFGLIFGNVTFDDHEDIDEEEYGTERHDSSSPPYDELVDVIGIDG